MKQRYPKPFSGYRSERLSFRRKMVHASATVSRKKNCIHSTTEVDISNPRCRLKKLAKESGEKQSFTAYIVCCFAQVLGQYPRLNSFIKRNKLLILDDLCISVLIEREYEGELVPEPTGIHHAQDKSYQQIRKEIQEAASSPNDKSSPLSTKSYLRFIPAFLLTGIVKIADRNIAMAKKYGKVAVTAVGMFSKEAVWFLPHGSGTVLLTVGSIIKRPVMVEGKFEEHEHLCLTVSFDHDIIDGAPAARFMNQLIETIKSGNLIRNKENTQVNSPDLREF